MMISLEYNSFFKRYHWVIPELLCIIDDLKEFGFKYTTLDLEGYKTNGSEKSEI